MQRLKVVSISILTIVIVAFLTKPTDKRCVAKIVSELIKNTKSGNSTKDTIIAIIVQGNIRKRIGVEDFIIYKKVVYQSYALVPNGALKPDNTEIAVALFGIVFIKSRGFKEVMRVNGL